MSQNRKERKVMLIKKKCAVWLIWSLSILCLVGCNQKQVTNVQDKPKELLESLEESEKTSKQQEKESTEIIAQMANKEGNNKEIENLESQRDSDKQKEDNTQEKENNKQEDSKQEKEDNKQEDSRQEKEDSKQEDNKQEKEEVKEILAQNEEASVQSQEDVNPKVEQTITLSISCNTILAHKDSFEQDKIELLPEDGVILETQDIAYEDGETVFDALVKATKAHKIHMEYTGSKEYKTNYIEGIHNIYEFDCGPLSGWMYKVNGTFPNYGCSSYKLKEGDVVEWVYTCDLGKDVGAQAITQSGEGK